jgi:hypothetical protein
MRLTCRPSDLNSPCVDLPARHRRQRRLAAAICCPRYLLGPLASGDSGAAWWGARPGRPPPRATRRPAEPRTGRGSPSLPTAPGRLPGRGAARRRGPGRRRRPTSTPARAWAGSCTPTAGQPRRLRASDHDPLRADGAQVLAVFGVGEGGDRDLVHGGAHPPPGHLTDGPKKDRALLRRQAGGGTTLTRVLAWTL